MYYSSGWKCTLNPASCSKELEHLGQFSPIINYYEYITLIICLGCSIFWQSCGALWSGAYFYNLIVCELT